MFLFPPFWEKIGKAKHQLRVLEVGCGGGAVGRWAGVEIDGEWVYKKAGWGCSLSLSPSTLFSLSVSLLSPFRADFPWAEQGGRKSRKKEEKGKKDKENRMAEVFLKLNLGN